MLARESISPYAQFRRAPADEGFVEPAKGAFIAGWWYRLNCAWRIPYLQAQRAGCRGRLSFKAEVCAILLFERPRELCLNVDCLLQAAQASV